MVGSSKTSSDIHRPLQPPPPPKPFKISDVLVMTAPFLRSKTIRGDVIKGRIRVLTYRAKKVNYDLSTNNVHSQNLLKLETAKT